MFLLNGIPVAAGMAILHIILLNFLAIFLEYSVIKKRETHKRILLRTMIANLASVLAGIFVFLRIPDLWGVNLESASLELHGIRDFLAILAGLTGMFIANVLIEYPFQFIGSRSHAGRMFISVLYANLLSNIPVVILYFIALFG